MPPLIPGEPLTEPGGLDRRGGARLRLADTELILEVERDLTGDGIDELIVGPGRGRVAEIRVFTQWGVELPAYRTIAFPGYTGGVIVAAGDVTGDGQADIIASI